MKRAILIGMALALAASPGAAQAATISPGLTTDELNAGGGCSLREAVDSINNGMDLHGCVATIVPDGYGSADTINLSAGTYNLTIGPGTNEDADVDGDLDVTRNLNIIGSGNPVIDQMVADERVLDVPGVDLLGLVGLTVQGGSLTTSSNQGGNIRHLGDTTTALTLNNVDVLNGVANTGTGGFGGGIYSTTPVVVQNGSLIEFNQAGGAAGVAGSGGGILVASPAQSLQVIDSEVSSNEAAFGGGAGTQGFGGGITFNAGGTTSVLLMNATIDSNLASGGGSEGAGQGGGVNVETGGTTTVTVTGGSISSNTAGGGNGGMTPNLPVGFGGGLYFSAGGGSSTSLSDVEVMGNKAGGNGGRATGFGGGIFAVEDLSVDNSNISGNTAGFNTGGGGAPDLEGNGGGINVEFNAPAALTITDSTVSLNKAGENQGNGGGVKMQGTGAISISDSTIAGNVAGEASGDGLGFGGGVARFANSSMPADLIQRTTISGNSAAGIGVAPQGGGLAFFSQGSLNINASTISGNTATNGNSTGIGGGMVLDSGNAMAGTYTVTNSTVSGNTATAISGQGGNGGGIVTGVPFSGTPPRPLVTITHSTIAGNAANTAGAGGLGGNLYSGGTGPNLVDLRASILAAGVGDAGSENCDSADSDMFETQGENVETTTPTQCELDAGMGDQIGVDPLLAALIPANGGDPANGVDTATRALLVGSPAINSVNAGCPPPITDQLGVARPQPAGGLCDAGAYEVPDTDADGILDTSDNCPTVAGPASNGGCPLALVYPPLTTPPTTTPPENPACAALRAKLKKAKTKRKKKKIRAQLRKLGC